MPLSDERIYEIVSRLPPKLRVAIIEAYHRDLRPIDRVRNPVIQWYRNAVWVASFGDQQLRHLLLLWKLPEELIDALHAAIEE